ncbi:MAG: hypothetical protein IJX79_03805 [Clostridia bacterium]|nr:hypothetical protein [Clostridia bacterium]
MELEEMLSGILKDEESLSKVQALAQQLGIGGEVQKAESDDNSDDLKRVMSLITRFKNQGEDNRTRLLLALKPILSEERAKRVDGAVKLLKLIQLLPLLKETDLFSSLF